MIAFASGPAFADTQSERAAKEIIAAIKYGWENGGRTVQKALYGF